MDEPTVPATRRGEHLEAARKRLQTLRFNLHNEHFSERPFGPEVVIPDTLITTLATKSSLQVEDLTQPSFRWPLAHQFATEVLAALCDVDQSYLRKVHQERTAKKQRKEEEKATALAQAKAEQEAQKALRKQQLDARYEEQAWRRVRDAVGSDGPAPVLPPSVRRYLAWPRLTT